MKRIIGKTISFFILALFLCGTEALAAEQSQSGQMVAAALGQMGYTEAPDEYTIFGEYYGIPHGYWCDMFLSWCADQAGMSKEAFPRSASCTQHCKMFTAAGCYQDSAARGGSYIPRQGDLVLLQNPDTGTLYHIGLVLYVEDGKVFSVEGNALTNRWDYPASETTEARRETEPEDPEDYVTCNFYPLTDPRIHGYAVPAYASREPLELEGFVDLGRYGGAAEQINAVAASGLMKGTSSHTFSPRAGMARGEFLQTVLGLFGLMGQWDGTPAFDDVPPSHPYYSSVMTARSAGLIPEQGNLFHPDQWIDGGDAQYILSALLTSLGMEDQTFSFTDGDLSQILTPYTTRGDIAQALYALCHTAALNTKALDGYLALEGRLLAWPLCYAYCTALPSLLNSLPNPVRTAVLSNPPGTPGRFR